MLDHAPGGVEHIVEVAFSSNIVVDEKLLVTGGTLSSYATRNEAPSVPFWPLVFKNITIYFLGSDDFPQQAKTAAAQDINIALQDGWSGFDIGATYSLQEIAAAHEAVERRSHSGRVVVTIS